MKVVERCVCRAFSPTLIHRCGCRCTCRPSRRFRGGWWGWSSTWWRTTDSWPFTMDFLPPSADKYVWQAVVSRVQKAAEQTEVWTDWVCKCNSPPGQQTQTQLRWKEKEGRHSLSPYHVSVDESRSITDRHSIFDMISSWAVSFSPPSPIDPSP